jgi:hypothetical protein
VMLSGSWSARSRAVGLSSSSAEKTWSPTVTRIGVTPDAAGVAGLGGPLPGRVMPRSRGSARRARGRLRAPGAGLGGAAGLATQAATEAKTTTNPKGKAYRRGWVIRDRGMSANNGLRQAGPPRRPRRRLQRTGAGSTAQGGSVEDIVCGRGPAEHLPLGTPVRRGGQAFF